LHHSEQQEQENRKDKGKLDQRLPRDAIVIIMPSALPTLIPLALFADGIQAFLRWMRAAFRRLRHVAR
jgi:hypothetical protein